MNSAPVFFMATSVREEAWFKVKTKGHDIIKFLTQEP
jgi:hypothetical protein